jgi:predicted transcriptional regulator
VFAAAVLMPPRLIREQYVRCERDFFRLCETFGASSAAMGRRLHTVIRPRASGES